jgi:copper chaperone
MRLATGALDLAIVARSTIQTILIEEQPMTHQFTLEDMTCGHCVSRVTKKLQTFDPDAIVSVDLAVRGVTIDGAAGRGDYAYAIRDAGYKTE